MHDLLYVLSERPDGAYVPIRIVPGGGDGDSCWWTHDLSNIQVQKAKVRMDEKTVKVMNVINSDQGLFVRHKEWTHALRG